MGRSKTDQQVKIFVEVLQNGELLSKTSRPFNKPGIIYLSSHPDSELSAPFYPIPTDIPLLKITRRGAEVDLDPNWEGFTTCNGKVEEISSNKRTNYTHLMKIGDYGSIAYNDLRILIRIGKERPKKKAISRSTGEYSGKILDLWIGRPIERKVLLVACLASLWLFGGLIYGLLNRPDDRPRELADLRSEYTLPFIHPNHLIYLPEVLQENYRRSQTIRSTYEFFKSFAATISGFTTDPSPLIFSGTQRLYREAHQDQHLKIEAIKEEQRNQEANLLGRQATAVLRIPTVHGETFEANLLRVMDKLEILHENLEMSLLSRIEASPVFKQEEEYDFELYRHLARQRSQSKSAASTGIESLSARERDMYQQTKNLSEHASFTQRRIKLYREPIVELSVENSSPIGLAEGSAPFVSFLDLDSLININAKIALLNASEFNAKTPEKIREPLLGEIEQHLIRNTIEKHRFELQLCFELALRRNQNIKGQMQWQWRLDSRGRISDLELIQTDIDDRAMIRCVQQKIARWPFPRPRRGSVQIQYPFSFAPARG